jgi:hypothetical protein
MSKDNQIIKDLEEKNEQIKKLKEQLEKLQGGRDKILNEIEPKIEISKEEVDPEKDYYNEIHFNDDYGIKVMSVVNHKLILSTAQWGGGGRLFEFNRFGETKIIPYSELMKIIQYHKNFFDDGLFTILEKKFYLKLGLENKNLKKEQIEKIIDPGENINNSIDLFKSASTEMKKSILTMIIEKLVQNGLDCYESLFITKLSKAADFDVYSKVDEIIAYRKLYNMND